VAWFLGILIGGSLLIGAGIAVTVASAGSMRTTSIYVSFRFVAWFFVNLISLCFVSSHSHS
jgi:hypothetical protein